MSISESEKLRRQKIAEYRRGKKLSSETRQKLSEAQRDKKCPPECQCPKHEPFSEERKKKISESLKGRKVSEETKQKISETLTGHKHSEESKQKIAEAMTGRTFTEEHRENMSKVRRSKFRGEPTDGCIWPIGDSGYKILCNMGDHPLAHNTQASEHRVVLWEKLGCESLDCEHECWWCGKLIQWRTNDRETEIQADHVDGNGLNNDPKNLVESCCSCNSRRGALKNSTDYSRYRDGSLHEDPIKKTIT